MYTVSVIMVFAVVNMYAFSIENDKDIYKLTRCSKFDFEEKLLEKLVRLEHKVDIFENKVSNAEMEIKHALKEVRGLNENTKSFIHQSTSGLKKHQATQRALLSDELGRINVTLKTVLDDLDSAKAKISHELNLTMVSVKKDVRLTNHALVQDINSAKESVYEDLKFVNASLLANFNSYKMSFEKKYQEDRSSFNKTFKNFDMSLRDITKWQDISNTKVAFTSCAHNDQQESSGYIVKFKNIKTNVGVTDTSTFVRSGKFEMEHDGVYLVSVTLTAFNTGIDYDLYVKGRVYVRIIEYDNKVAFQRGDVTVAVEINKGDNVWVELNGSMYVNSAFSCITIVKIK